MAPCFKYSKQKLEDAMEQISKKNMSLYKASKVFGVPKTTLHDKFKGKAPSSYRKMGPSSILKPNQEEEIVNWILQQGRRGFPPHLHELFDSVQAMVKEERRGTPFKDGRPGRTWFRSFRRRHPSISVRMPEQVSRARASITRKFIEDWFQRLKNELQDLGALHVLETPSRIFKAEESCVSLAPATGKVLAKRGRKDVYEVAPRPEKRNITFLGTFSADGCILPPTIVFPYTRDLHKIVQSVPNNWNIGASESGWMKGKNLFEYVVDCFLPWLTENNIDRPVLLLLDGHRSHMSLQLSKFCDKNGIILYLLPPNTTHILQPADVAIFKPLKANYRKEIVDYRKIKGPNYIIQREDVAPLLKKALDNLSKETIKNGFQKCGIFPFDPTRVDYDKLLKQETETSNGHVQTQADENPYKTAWKVMEEGIGADKLARVLLGDSMVSTADFANFIRTVHSKANTQIEGPVQG